jgi:pimeloyl-ACP methyl ester carboxylesterase
VRVPFLTPPDDVLQSRLVRTTNGRNVGVYEYGDPNGSPVFALHGTPASGAGFDWTDAPARERGLRVIAPDRPGVGQSDPFPMESVSDYGEELRALADALGVEKFALLGYSGGGPYALAVAHEMPERVTIAEIVAGAGEIGAWATLADLARSDRQLTWLSLHAPLAARGVLRVAEIGARISPKTALRSTATEFPAPDRKVMHEMGTPREALALFTSALARTTAGAVTDYALLARPWHVALEEITVPVHCWHGTADTAVPLSHTEALLERIPDATLTTWPDEGHLALITHVAEVLDDISQSHR